MRPGRARIRAVIENSVPYEPHRTAPGLDGYETQGEAFVPLAGIVHRDLKPGNVMLTSAGANLLDFGLAKLSTPGTRAGVGVSMPPTQEGLTAQGSILGTPQHMAPEQLEGKDTDERTNIFSVGALIYEMATGQKAFAGTSQASLISAIMSSDPPPISVSQPLAPLALDRVVQSCLAKDPKSGGKAQPICCAN